MRRRTETMARGPRTAAPESALSRAAGRTGTDVVARLRVLLEALDITPHGELDLLGRQAVAALEGVPADRVWLALAVLTARLPGPEEVTLARRTAVLDGPGAVLDLAAHAMDEKLAHRRVQVARGRTLVDLGDLVSSPLGTGIQRVARNVAAQWVEHKDVLVTAWTEDFDAMRVVPVDERDRVLAGRTPVRPGATAEVERRAASPTDVLVPWEGTYVLPELAIDPTRCAGMQGLAMFSRVRTGVIGFDCVPLTSSETSALGFAGVFALNLGAVAHFDVVGTISRAAATEYEGWRRMLEGAGLRGPRIEPVLLPAHAPEPSDEAVDEARHRLLVPGLPMVLCVGSHEPRKNHLAVLHAAELLWRRGLRFSLVFVGGNAWGSERFEQRLAELQGAGRPVESISRMPDRLLWAAYRLARCTVFPSTNEGFGLPVAESLAAGTPAITSAFGSMQEIADGGGALTVDPRDDGAIADALSRLLTDDTLHGDLTEAARSRDQEDWATYARALWDLFHDV